MQKEEREREKYMHTDASSYASAASARSSARSKSTSITAIRRATCTHVEKENLSIISAQFLRRRYTQSIIIANHLVIFSIGILSYKLCFGQLLVKCTNTFIILIRTLLENFAIAEELKEKKKQINQKRRNNKIEMKRKTNPPS